MLSRVRRFGFVLLAIILAADARGADVLFIGNSFTFGATVPGLAEHGGVPALVEAIARTKGIDLKAESLTSPGKDWSWHLGRPTTAAALEKTWSWVVLQDYSLRPTRVGNVPQFLQDGAVFSARIAQHSPQAGIVLYETWARPAGWFYGTRSGRRFTGPAQMMADLHGAYAELAQKLAALDPKRPVRIAPVGTAFARCRAEFPSINLDARDQHHATAEGYYLAALVLFETIDHQTASDAPLLFFDGVIAIPSTEAGELQRVADEVAGPQPAPSSTPVRKAAGDEEKPGG